MPSQPPARHGRFDAYVVARRVESMRVACKLTATQVAEAIGLALPFSAGPPAEVTSRDDYALRAGEAVMKLLEKRIRPRDICTREAFSKFHIPVK